MRSRYYKEGEDRASGVKDLFATIAPRYDLINDLQSFGLHRWWKRRMLNVAGVQAGERALDVCCGTGDIALGLARRGVRVIGLDFSDAMLAVARRRGLRREGVAANPEFIQGDALALPFGPGQFDLLTIAYGLRNLKDIDAGLAELARVAKPGGRLLILDFGKPRQALWRAMYLTHLKTVVPWLGRIFCGDRDTHAYILDSLERYPGAEEIQARMERAGWEQVVFWRLLGGVMTIHRGVRSAEA
ncbi:MAG: bifunctional demethylmenaquinone methyltransferase/2-methoxy-6-polyprenyl-1,4-benzoquinol methylase UbiE [Verrucomicrobiales bacterium]|nr:bifunctional demethylmenaquinone methyltransferase/2-methoxy-6-polyprenyl-1,4-benzoquinol methylase UbiE [Verrucomicrobiales bacterium]